MFPARVGSAWPRSGYSGFDAASASDQGPEWAIDPHGNPCAGDWSAYLEPEAFFSCSSILLRLNEPGDWLGGYSFIVIRNCAASAWIGTITNGRSRNQSL